MVRKLLVVSGVLVLGTTVFCQALLAQKSAVAPAIKSTATSKQPAFATIAVTGLDRLLSDINYLTTSAEAANSGMILGAMSAPFTEGLDRARPAGVMFQLVNELPVPLIVLPVKDLTKFLKGLEAFTGPPDVDADGTIIIQAGPRLIFIRDRNGWAFASTDRSALDSAPEDPMILLGPLTQKHDLSIDLNVQAVPKELRDRLMSQMEMAFEQAMQMQAGNGNAGNNADAAKIQVAMMKKMFEQLEIFRFGWVIDPNEKYTGLDVSVTAASGTEMAKMMSEMQTAPSRYTGFVQPDAAVFMHTSMTYGPLYKKQQLEALNAVPMQIKGALDAAVDDGKLPADARQHIEAMVNEILAIAKDGVDKGYSDSGLVVRMDNGVLGAAAAISPISGPKVEQLAAKIKDKVNGQNGITMKLNAAEHAGVKLHTFEIAIPASEDGARKVFGDTFQILIGTGPEAVYLGFGPEGRTRVTQAITSAAQGPKSIPNQLPMQMQVSVLQIMEYVQTKAQHPVVDMVLQKLREYPGVCDVVITSETITRGSTTHIRIEEGLLHAIGVAAQTARQQPQF